MSPTELCKKNHHYTVTHRNAVRVLLTNAFSLSLALLEGMLVLELAPHIVGVDKRVIECE